MNICITGTGMLGAYAARELIGRGHVVTMIDRRPFQDYLAAVAQRRVSIIESDIRDDATLTEAFQRLGIEVVVHTAAPMPGDFTRDRFDSFSSTVYGSLCLAEAAHRAHVRRIVLSSSLAVYAFPEPDPFTEASPLQPEAEYDHAKLLTELVLTSYCNQIQVELCILRLAGIFGVMRPTGGGWMGRNLQDIVEEVIRTNHTTIPASLLGTNEYLYAKDAAIAIALACEAPNSPSVVLNIGPGILTSARMVTNAFVDLFPDAEISFDDRSQDDAPAYLNRKAPLALDKAAAFIGYHPMYVPFERGLADYIRDLRSELGSSLR